MRAYLALFRNRNFLLHWTAGAISNVGDFFNSVALVKILSEDPAHLGFYMALVMIAKVVPSVVLGTVAGVVADRLPRRTVMIVSDLLRAVLVLGLVFVEGPAPILMLVSLASIVSVFFNPASGAMLPNIVKKDELATAGALGIMTQRMAMLLGNGIGAAVLIGMGAHNVFYIDAVSFVISALLIAGMTVSGMVDHATVTGSGAGQGLWTKFKGDLAETAAFLREAYLVRHLLITLGIVAVADSSLNVLLITFFTQGLGLPAESLGYVWALFGATSVLGALMIGAFGKRITWQPLTVGSAFYIWMTMMGALIFRSPVPSITFLALLGLGSGAANVGLQVATGTLVPDQVRGRIFGTWGMVQSLIYVAGVLVAGSLSDRFGSVPVLMGFTTFFLIAGIYAFLAFRSAPVPVPVPTSATRK